MNESARYYPLVGALVGLAVGLVFLAAETWLPLVPSIIISTAFGLYLTGAFHEDGFADLCDGLGGGATAGHALQIMKDSRLGTYGVAGLTLMLALKLSLLVEAAAALTLATFLTVLVIGHGLSRTSAILVIVTSTYAREEGKAKPLSVSLSNRGILVAAIISLGLVMAGLGLLGGAAVFVGIAVMGLAHIFIRRLFERKINGYTGDCLGATQQMSEVGFYLGVVACI